MEDDDTFYAHELENLVIKDKEYYRKRRKKHQSRGKYYII